MKINMNIKPDYSFLFSNMNSGSGPAPMSTFLSDYASIRNGSYYKLMKAYYAKPDRSDRPSAVNPSGKESGKDTAKDLTGVQTATDRLKESADALLDTDFRKADTEEILSGINAFVKEYNSVLSSTKNLNTVSVLSRTVSLINTVKANENILSRLGIHAGADNTLSVDEKILEQADRGTLESIFSGNASFAYGVSAQASLIHFAAANAGTSGAYNINGTYTHPFASGNLFHTYF